MSIPASFGIIRVEKVKSFQRFEQRLKHDYRLTDVRNANESKKGMNLRMWNVDDCRQIWRSNFGQGGRFAKRRKDAVLALDYMVTASPDFFVGNDSEGVFFEAAYNFLVEKHGANNILSATIHYDETTPHMHIMVIPEKDGRLNARHFTGGKKVMRELQDDFHREVGAAFNLRRGRKNHVAAKHETIKDFYRRLNDWESLEREIERKQKILAELEWEVERSRGLHQERSVRKL